MSVSVRRRPALAASLLLLSLPARAEVVEALGCPQLQFGPQSLRASVDQTVVVNADKVLLEEGGLSDLAGMVTLTQGDKTFSAEALSFDDSTRVVTVGSESLFRDSTLAIRSQSAHFDLNAESGAFMDTQFVLPSRSARGTADRVEIMASGQAELERAAYTTCGADSKAWFVEADEITLNHDTGLGSAHGAKLRFMGVPIVYLPYFQFPIDNQRRSGLLYPTAGQLSGAGFDFRWPVYLNLSENYDATYTPRLMTQRGLQSGLDFRYLLDQGKGEARYEYLDDRKFGDQRSLFRFDHVGRINQRLGIEATYAETSDSQYFEDLGGGLASTSITHLEQTAQLTYQSPGAYTIHALVQNFQPVATNLLAADDPYKRLPQIRLEALTRKALFNTRAGIDSEFVNFARDNSLEGARVKLAPYLLFGKETASWYFTSQADLHYTAYELNGVPGGQDKQIERSIPVISAETGLTFERVTDSGALQQLIPRGFALYVPYENQDELPLFDTGEPDFDFVQLFARNRFSGEDRLADAQHVAGAATLRQLDPVTGQAQWSASIGQLFRFRAPRVEIPGFPAPESGATEFIGQFDYQLSRDWSSVLAAQWSPRDSRFDRTQFGLRYRDPVRDNQFDIAYRYRRDLLEQADMSLLMPIGGAWKIAGRTRFSLRDSNSRENYLGLEYGTCCWAIRTSYRRFIADTSGDFDSGVYLQLELKGLGRIGGGGDSLLPRDETEAKGS